MIPQWTTDAFKDTCPFAADPDREEAAFARIPATDFGHPAHDAALPAILYLKVGARVMLCTNLSTKHSLMDGALGTVIEIVYAPSIKPPDLPICVVL